MRKYVSFRGHAEVSVPLPVEISGATMYCFALKATKANVQNFIDDTLNAVAPGEFEYDFLGNYALLVYAYAERGTAPSVGWEVDREVAIFLPVLQKAPATTIPKMLVWPAYVFIESAIGMPTGREVLGYNKTLGTIKVPAKRDDSADFSIKTTIFKNLDAQCEGQDATLIRTSKMQRGQLGTLRPAWRGTGQLFKALGDELGPWTASNGSFKLSDLTVGIPVPMINLKQFRDIQNTDMACYQALAESENVSRIRGGGPLLGKFRTTVTDCESHQINSDLGLDVDSGGQCQVSFAFWVKLDFTIEPGRAVWTAP